MSDPTVVDARGMACPLPVINAKKAIESASPGDRIVVRVDNEAAQSNVARMAKGAGCAVSREGSAPDLRVVLTAGEAGAQACTACVSLDDARAPKVVAYVNADVMGSGDRELGALLMKAFLQTLLDVSPRPEHVVFVNAGVFLTTEGSPVLPALEKLERRGIGIVSCGTCLDFFRRMDLVRVGVVSNMYEIVSLLAGADRVVAP